MDRGRLGWGMGGMGGKGGIRGIGGKGGIRGMGGKGGVRGMGGCCGCELWELWKVETQVT